MRSSGQRWRNARMQSAKCPAPPSRRSSRSTEVMTTYESSITSTVSARRSGSPGSRGAGRPCATSQNGQRRVQMSPMIMKVAVPCEKHSPMLGQEASSHTVCSRWARNTLLSLCTAGPIGALTRIHGGFRGIGPTLGITFTGMREVLSRPRISRVTRLTGGRADMLGSVTSLLVKRDCRRHVTLVEPTNAGNHWRRTRSSHMLSTRQNRAAVCSAS